MIELFGLLVFFPAFVFGLGPVLMPASLGAPLQRVTVGVAASLTLLYLLGFGVYVLNLPATTHGILLVLSLVVVWLRRSALGQLWADPDVRAVTVVWLAVAAWLLGWQFAVYSYSGATWQGDWYEHYDRARFFLEHWDLRHRFLGAYSLSARPPLVNLVEGFFLSLGGTSFHVFQAICSLLASLVVWPVCLLQRRFARNGAAGQFGWTALLLMALPMLAQNAAFTWTKLPTVFFILTGIGLLSDRTAEFPVRLAGWLSLTAGMLAHYSAGPWIVAVVLAEIARNPGDWRRIFRRQNLVIGLACGLLFGTWLGWSTLRLGLNETVGSNTTVTDGTGLSLGQRLGQAAENLYYTAVPVLFRQVDYGGYRADDAVVRLRDGYFNAVQSSALMIAGSLGVMVAGSLLWLERKHLRWGEARYWGVLLGIGLVLGVVVHTEVIPLGVGQICLQPFALLVIAWLAARLPERPALRWVLALGMLLDVMLGIVLHFGVQSLWLVRWRYPDKSDVEIIRLFGHGARANFEARQTLVPFLADLPGALPATVFLLLAAGLLLAVCFRLPAVTAAAGRYWSKVRGSENERSPLPVTRFESALALAVFVASLGFSFWAVGVGWKSKALPGVEFRQAQTALSAFWIKADHDFSPAYPTPILGKPWSIPMEFPLYQWTVVGVSDLTNWSLTKAGRAVSIACFYLGLPAIFLLLRRWSVPSGRRWLVLAVIVSCPLYIFYTRAFLVETMALMFSLWFWVAFERAVADRGKIWLAVAVIAGSGAGLVKVTTFLLYLLPAGWWAAQRLWRARRGDWRRELGWMAAAVTLPFAVTLWWLHFSDATKASNPLASFIVSGNLQDFNLGTNATRLSAEMWRMKLRIIREELTWLPVVALCGLVAVAAGRARWRELLGCVACFASVLVAFPVLYALHDYYYVANTVLLLLAMGLALVALAESRVPRAVVFLMLGLVVAGQTGRYFQHYYETQKLVQPGGNGLTQALRAVTNPDDVIVILGQDWNSITPYYAQRRALMFRDDRARDPQAVEAALARLEPDRIGALVIAGQPDGRQWLVDRVAARGLAREPVFVWHDVAVYLPAARRTELIHSLLDNQFPEVALAPGVAEPKEDLKAVWRDLASLRKWQKGYFHEMRPQPVRYFSTFGPAADGSSGTFLFGAHPVTRLVFALPAGAHTLHTTLELPPDAWRLDKEHSDGVEVTLFAGGAGDEKQVLATRFFNPRESEADRGPGRPLEFKFNLLAAGEVELYFGPGPNQSALRDWIMLGPLTIE